MYCRFVPFVPGRRPTDERDHPGLGSSDNVALVTGQDLDNRAVVLFDVSNLPLGAAIEVTVTVDGQPVPGWDRRPIELLGQGRQRLELRPDEDLAGVDLDLTAGFLRRARFELRVTHEGSTVASDELWLDVCDIRNLGSLYARLVDRLVAADTTRQAVNAGLADPGVAYHPWYPVLRIGGDKAALYTAALVADIVGKEHHLTDDSWLLRVGVYLELLTCFGIAEAVREDVGDLLEPEERAAFEQSAALAEIRRRIDPIAWREVWGMRRIVFSGLGSPRTGPVSVLNLLRKRNATLRFLRVHHEDLKQAIELAGPNRFNAQETWQRVFRDCERAMLRQVGHAFPELGFLPGPAREVVLWERLSIVGQQGVYPTMCHQYRSSMNTVADWAKARGLMDHAGVECVPPEASLLEALVHRPAWVAVLQREDGLGPDLTVVEPALAAQPTTEEVERLLAGIPILRMLSADEVHALAVGARPLLLGPTQRFVVEDFEGTSLFLVGEGAVEVRLRNQDGTDWLVETMGRGEVVGEMALLTGGKRSATVRAAGETVVYEISRQLYAPLLLAHPEWLEELATVMEARLARRRSRMAQADHRVHLQPLLEQIRHNFFG
jgi:CRP-like cAMP-binding protein